MKAMEINRMDKYGQRKRQAVQFLIVLLGTIWSSVVQAKPIVYDLCTEQLQNPQGIDVAKPRLSWKIQADERATVQEAYHILVASSPEKLQQNIGDLWDSGKQLSHNSINRLYAGKLLQSRDQVFWKVRVYTNKGETGWSEPARWTMGLLHYKDWVGRWIGFDRYFPTDDEQQGRLAARYFRKEFKTAKKVKTATAYIMGLGLYELYINGKKMGDQVLAPIPTDYSKNIKYNVLDVTQALSEGQQHAIGVMLGNGRFYAMRQTKPYKIKTFGFPKMLMQIEVTYADGSTETIKTDDSWKGTTTGPITANNEYDGECYDARQELGQWTNSGFDDHSWLKANYVQEPGGNYEAQLGSMMKVMRDISPVSIRKRPGGSYIIDFGQNFSGWVKLRVHGQRGTALNLRFAESLTATGDLFTTNLRDAKATDQYILRGESMEEWEPHFTYHGFRYVEVSGYPGEPKKENFIGRLVYDDMANVGSFASSNPLLNQIHQNAWWGIASNYKGIPVDCPQRNERQPWLGDRPVSAYGENFLFDNANFYRKWLDDIRLSQKEDGAIPDVAPAFWKYYSDNISWPGTYLFVADMLYQQTGDTMILQRHYPYMKKWMDYMQSRYSNTAGIITKDSYGDWCFPPASIEAGRGKIADKKYPSALISSAYYYQLLQVMARFSALLGKPAEQSDFLSRAVGLRKNFNAAFYQAEGYYGSNTLTDNLLALQFGLVEEQHQERLKEHILSIIEKKNKGHLSTGVIGTQWIMRSLTAMGRADLAYKIATNKTYPSWGYMVENGATTIWELWNGNTAHPKMNSQNHVMMLGDLLVWLYEDLAGIKSEGNAFQQIRMQPQFLAGPNHIQASYGSSFGPIESSWTKSNSVLKWRVSIPANTTAELYFPTGDLKAIREHGIPVDQHQDIQQFEKAASGSKVLIGSGTYQFTINL
ncbi:alpha-L-rhamnosidase [Sphingobacterium sp. N143]|uniref:alpha-L-rhamnosidase n=1 Tax=Sphingobacterium sp. N143 TaxID=2746727 RepID=UPI00257907CC|nr:alpha-L-rhamnosidase [Sphingobacterium sp. N143]